MPTSPKRWAVWQLPRAARLLVVTVWCSSAATVLACVVATNFRVAEVATTAAFTAAALVSVEVSMRLAWPRARSNRISADGLGVWILPVALLAPPIYVVVVALVVRTYVQLRIWHAQPMKFTYTAAAQSLGYAATSEAFRLADGSHRSIASNQLIGSGRAVAALALAIAVWWVAHNILVFAVVALTVGKEAVVDFIRNAETHVIDAVAVCTGVAIAVLWTVHPIVAALLVPPILLMQQQLYSGLRQAVRRDMLTDLASTQYWRAVAGREIERAWASGAPLAVLLIDIDNFKAVNDKYGHLVGDDVLAAVAAGTASALRPRDLVGRLGGEEFGAVLSGLDLAEATRAAERVREQVADVRVRSDGGDWISVTVSVGIAELDTNGSTLHDLVSAADRAMYAAKAAGRNCVRTAGVDPNVIDLHRARATGT